MTNASRDQDELHPLADIDQVIHASARLMVLTYLYVVESVDYVFLKQIWITKEVKRKYILIISNLKKKRIERKILSG